jgi:hypothetical protein
MDNDDRDAPQNDRDDHRAQVAVTNDDLARERAQTNRENDRQDKQANRREKVTLWVAVAGVVIAAASTGISWFQWDLMRQQLSDARESSKIQDKVTARTIAALEKQADAMTNSIGPATTSAATAAETNAKTSERIAKASESSVEATREALRLEQRAWIAMDTVTAFPLTAGGPAAVHVSLRNTGKTPAVNVKTGARMRVFAKGVEPSLTFAGSQWLGQQSNSILAPNSTVNLRGMTYDREGRPYNLLDNDVAGFADGAIVLYFDGVVTYDDIFKRSHRTTFCTYWDPAISGYNDCARGNEAN